MNILNIPILNMHQLVIKLGLSQVALVVKTLSASARDPGLILGLGRPLEEGMATHSSILAGRIP